MNSCKGNQQVRNPVCKSQTNYLVVIPANTFPVHQQVCTQVGQINNPGVLTRRISPGHQPMWMPVCNTQLNQQDGVSMVNGNPMFHQSPGLVKYQSEKPSQILEPIFPIDTQDAEAVATWVLRLANQRNWDEAEVYAESFRKNKINGPKMVKLSNTDLWKTLNIKKLGHRLEILKAVRRICPSQNTSTKQWDDCEPESDSSWVSMNSNGSVRGSHGRFCINSHINTLERDHSAGYTPSSSPGLVGLPMRDRQKIDMENSSETAPISGMANMSLDASEGLAPIEMTRCRPSEVVSQPSPFDGLALIEMTKCRISEVVPDPMTKIVDSKDNSTACVDFNNMSLVGVHVPQVRPNSTSFDPLSDTPSNVAVNPEGGIKLGHKAEDCKSEGVKFVSYE